MNWQAWRDFLITVFFLGVAFIIALLSSIAAEQRKGEMAAIAAAISLVMALLGALYIVPRLARNVRLEILRFAVRTTVTVEGLLFIVFLVVIGFAAWNTGNNLLYMVLSVMLAFLVAANLIARLSLVDVAVQLRFPDHMFAGEPASLAITLMNHKRLIPSYSLMVEGLSDTEDGDEGDGESEGQGRPGRRARASASRPEPGLGKLAYFVLAPARSSVRQRVEYTFERRGCYPVTGFRLSTKFPAGFFKKRRRIDATGEILVYPKPQPLDDFYHALPMLAGQVQSHVRGSGDDLYSIRAYQPSDHMRHIDWKATAKSRQMMVREHMREDEWRLTIVFDTTRPERFDKTPAEEENSFEEKFERAIVKAASLANHFILERSEVELITPNEGHNVPSGTGHDHLFKILRSLATLQPSRKAPERDAGRGGEPRRWKLFGRKAQASSDEREAGGNGRAGVSHAWKLLDEVPVLADERRFKVLITSAAKGTIPANVWRSSHVEFIDDL